MDKTDFIAAKLKTIADHLTMVELYIDQDIVGDDARHAVDDLKQADRELKLINPENVDELYKVKPLFDRIKAVQISVRCMRNNVARAETEIDSALEQMANIANLIESSSDQDL